MTPYVNITNIVPAPKGERMRWTFDLRIEDSVTIVVRHCLASYGREGDLLVRMPEDREGSPLVKLPRAWIIATIAEMANELGRGVSWNLSPGGPPEPVARRAAMPAGPAPVFHEVNHAR
jgi:hypothetical protein